MLRRACPALLVAAIVAVQHPSTGSAPLQPGHHARPREALRSQNGTGMCIDGRVVPQLYLIGVQKCASTSTYSLLQDYGAHTASGKDCETKEVHTLSSSCPWYFAKGDERNACSHTALSPWGTGGAKKQGTYARCGEACGDGKGVLTDATPDSSRVIGLGRSLHHVFFRAGLAESQFAFVVLLRGGLERMASAFYMMTETTPIAAKLAICATCGRDIEHLVVCNEAPSGGVDLVRLRRATPEERRACHDPLRYERALLRQAEPGVARRPGRVGDPTDRQHVQVRAERARDERRRGGGRFEVREQL